MRFWRRRRRRGRHELGATVTARPSVPAPVHPGPRIELSFRDGTTAVLDPASDQARQLEALARDLRG